MRPGNAGADPMYGKDPRKARSMPRAGWESGGCFVYSGVSRFFPERIMKREPGAPPVEGFPCR